MSNHPKNLQVYEVFCQFLSPFFIAQDLLSILFSYLCSEQTINIYSLSFMARILLLTRNIHCLYLKVVKYLFKNQYHKCELTRDLNVSYIQIPKILEVKTNFMKTLMLVPKSSIYLPIAKCKHQRSPIYAVLVMSGVKAI